MRTCLRTLQLEDALARVATFLRRLVPAVPLHGPTHARLRTAGRCARHVGRARLCAQLFAAPALGRDMTARTQLTLVFAGHHEPAPATTVLAACARSISRTSSTCARSYGHSGRTHSAGCARSRRPSRQRSGSCPHSGTIPRVWCPRATVCPCCLCCTRTRRWYSAPCRTRYPTVLCHSVEVQYILVY